MQPQQVSITGAFSSAFERMKAMLFQPFALEKWLTLGFTAWLAGAGASGSFGSSFSFPGGGGSPPGDWDPSGEFDARSVWETIADWLGANPGWVLFIGGGCLFLFAFILLILWLQSRGTFMFLDNVVHDRAEVVAPWKRYGRLGNSLFLFRLALGALAIVFMALLTGLVVVPLAAADRPFESPVGCAALVIGFLLLMAMIVVWSFVKYLLIGFVVPLMYRYDLSTVDAWRRFAPILRQNFWTFVLSGLFLFVVVVGVGIGLLIAGILTCCIGLILLAVPYVGTVLILPVPVTYRLFTLTLLDQIDPGYFPAPAPA